MKKLSALILVFIMVMAALVACGSKDEAPSADLTAARDYLYSMYKDSDGSVTGADYQVVGVVAVNGVTYTVEWTVDNDKIKIVAGEKLVTIDVDEKSATEEQYTLTATVKDANGNAAEPCTFKHTVPAYAINTWAEYIAAEKDAPLVIQGVVTGIIAKSAGSSYNCLYMQDEVGGYYVYDMESDPLEAGIKVGMTVEAKGVKDIYNGTHELKDATVAIADSTVKTVEAVDYTELYKAAADLKATALVEKQGLLVTIKGVELQPQSADDVSGNYYRFKLGELSSYVRISGSTCPLNAADKETFKKTFAENVGSTADVTGVICVYDDAFYLTPVTVDSYKNFATIERTPAEKVAYEKNLLSVIEAIKKDSAIDLLATGSIYNDVAITWTSDNACAVVANGKLTVTLQKDAQTVKLTATLTCGDATDTAEFTIAVSAKPTTAPVAIDTPAAGTAYKIYMVHPNANKNGLACYLTGKADSKEYYLATTDDPAAAADIFAEAVEGGFQLYVMDGTNKVYINIRSNGNYVNNLYEATAQCVYTWDATLKTFVTKVGDDTYTFGMKKTSNYTTIEAKKVTDADCAFAQVVAMVEAGPSVPSNLTAGTPYYIYMVHPNADKNDLICFLTGKADSKEYYLATTDSVVNAAAFKLEAVEGGFHVYTMNGDKKVYLNIRANGNYVNNLYEDTAQCVYTYDATLKTLVTKVGEDTYTFGMKKTSTYTTIEAKKVTDADCAFANFVIWVGELPKVEAGPAADATISFADKATRTEYSASAQKWVANGITFTNEKAASTTDVGDYANPVRCYKSSSIKVEYTGMKKVVFVCTTDKGTDGLKDVTIDGATVEISGNNVTVTFANAVNSFTVAELKAQIRFSSIEIYK